jgi:rhodanese-related sulfurtransferase
MRNKGKKAMKILPDLSIAMAVIIGIAIVIATVFLIPQPANAATLQPEKPEVKTAINEFLKSIPGDYYVVGSVEKFKNFVATKAPLVVDVREPSEYAEGHIANAVNIPLRSLTENLDKIPTDKPALLYCTSGHRTAIAMTVLRVLGYDNISSFPPSIKGWTAAGEPLEK